MVASILKPDIRELKLSWDCGQRTIWKTYSGLVINRLTKFYDPFVNVMLVIA